MPAESTARWDIAIPRVSQDPPSEFLVFPMGEFVATQFADDGGIVRRTFKYDAESGQKIMAFWRDRGLRLQIDFEHTSLAPAGDGSTPAAGFFAPEARPDGLWATSVRWSDLGYAAVRAPVTENGQQLAPRFAYTSAVFRFDSEGRPTVLRNIALTNDPAMDNQEPLMAARAVPFESHPAVDRPWDADGARSRLKRWARRDPRKPVGKKNVDWRRYGMGFAAVVGDPESFGSYVLPHHDVVDGRLVTVKSGVEHAAGRIDQVKGLSEEDKAAVRKHLAEHYKQWGGTPPWNETTATLSAAPSGTPTEGNQMDELLKACQTALAALSAKIDDHGAKMAECTASLSAVSEAMKIRAGKGAEAVIPADGLSHPDAHAADDLQAHLSAKLQADVVALTGKTGPEAAGMVMAWRDTAAKVPALNEQIATLTSKVAEHDAKKATDEMTAIVDKAIAEKRFAPSAREALLTMGRSSNVAMLSAYVGTMPVMQVVAAPSHESVDTSGTVTLTPEEKKMAKLTGQTEQAILNAKIKRVGSTATA